MDRSLVRGGPGAQFAGPRSTAAKYSNAVDFDRASLPSNAQIRAQTRLVDRHAPSSQRGGQGFESPQLHRYGSSSKALSRSVARHCRRAWADASLMLIMFMLGMRFLRWPTLPFGRRTAGPVRRHTADRCVTRRGTACAASGVFATWHHIGVQPGRLGHFDPRWSHPGIIGISTYFAHSAHGLGRVRLVSR